MSIVEVAMHINGLPYRNREGAGGIFPPLFPVFVCDDYQGHFMRAFFLKQDGQRGDMAENSDGRWPEEGWGDISIVSWWRGLMMILI